MIKLRNTYLGYIYLFFTILFFSTYEVAGKKISGEVNPFQVNFIRFLIGGLILMLILYMKKDIKISAKHFIHAVLPGVLNVAISMSLIQLSLSQKNASAALVAVIFSSNPVFVSLFSSIIDKEKITVGRIIAIAISMLGILTAFSDKLQNASSDIISPLLALVSAIFYGLYTVLAKNTSSHIGSIKMNAYSFMAGSSMLIPVFAFSGYNPLHIPKSAVPYMIYLGVFVTGLAYVLYFMGLQRLGAGKGSMVFFIKPILASIIAAFALGENISWRIIAGGLMILSGMTISKVSVLNGSSNRNCNRTELLHKN